MRFASREEYVRYVLAGQADAPVDKNDFILSRVAGKSVLDIGCAGGSIETIERLGQDWLHGRIRGIAGDAVGIDILEEAVARLNHQGYNVICADATSLHLGRTFDVVVCGDIIEHLANPLDLLISVSLHMHQDSECIVTTPNPFSASQFFRILLDGNCGANADHTCWVDPNVAWELVQRSPLRIADFRWLENTVWPIEPQRRYWRYLGMYIARWLRRRNRMFCSDFALILKLR